MKFFDKGINQWKKNLVEKIFLYMDFMINVK